MNDIKKVNPLAQYSVLYVEDNFDIAEEVEFFLKARVKNLFIGKNGEEGLELFKEHKPDLVITDIQMPKMNGIQMIQEIREINMTVPILITTAFNESDYLLKAINLNVDSYLMKPLNLKEMIKRLEKIIEPHALKKQLVDKNRELEEINENLDKISQEKTKRLEYLYRHDPLTGLFNFLKLSEDLETGNYKNLILLDISGFSVINKQYGKVFSNLVLKSVAEALSKHVSEKIRLFKTESDHFVFLTQENEASKVEQFCLQLISFFDTQMLDVEDVGINIRFCMGISKIEENMYPMVNAEYALEMSKEFGSRYYYFYDESLESVKKAQDAIKWLDITRTMIENDNIEPFYQAITDISTGEIVKYEVLARGYYEGEVLCPYFFLGSAERLGLMGSITRMIINKSFAYFEDTEICFSINLTQRDLLDKELINFLKQKLEMYSIEPSRVTFEILENVTVSSHHALILEKLQLFARMGFEIAIDDFGVENSSFSRLVEIDFDYIKIDGLFIKDLDVNPKDKSIVSAIVGLAKALGIKTIAEFVETEKIYEIVKECGVDMVQGYYIGKPESTI